MAQFEYSTTVNLDEKILVEGKEQLRYGRLKQRGYEHNPENAPLRPDGTLFDLSNFGRIVYPVKQQELLKKTSPSPTGTIYRAQQKLEVPGGCVHSNVRSLG